MLLESMNLNPTLLWTLQGTQSIDKSFLFTPLWLSVQTSKSFCFFQGNLGPVLGLRGEPRRPGFHLEGREAESVGRREGLSFLRRKRIPPHDRPLQVLRLDAHSACAALVSMMKIDIVNQLALIISKNMKRFVVSGKTCKIPL
jgi:hypothetical protein